MDRVTMVDQNGRIYFFEPPNTMVYELFDRNINAPERTINRVSNSEWAFWAITADFEVCLYVYQRNFPIQAAVSAYENQKYAVFGKSDKKRWIKPNNRFEFSSEDGRVEMPKEGFLLPSDNWRWQGGWYLSDKNSGDDGWSYSTSFTGNFREKPFFYAFVRRRKWIRKRSFISYNTFIEIDSPIGLEFVNDVSVGGWLMPNQILKGFLSVWIVTNNGRIFFRENVSFENPEGTNWYEIELPDNLTALSISCSQNGSLWIVTCEDKVLIRTGIDSNVPYGDNWTIINPYPDATFIQVTANLNLVYALDMHSNVFLLNVDENYEWIKVLKDLSDISLSISDKLWALSHDKRHIFIGSKIHSIEDRFKFSWRTIQSPIRLDKIDAAIAFDQIDDLANLKLSSLVNNFDTL